MQKKKKLYVLRREGTVPAIWQVFTWYFIGQCPTCVAIIALFLILIVCEKISIFACFTLNHEMYRF